MASKLVKYVGSSNGKFSASKYLKKGMFYEVAAIKQGKDKTFYVLEGITGSYDSNMFIEAPIYLAVSRREPEVGQPLRCLRISKSGEKHNFVSATTSTIQNIHKLNGNTFTVYTMNSCYIVQVV